MGGVIVGGRRIKCPRFAADTALLAEEEIILRDMLLELNDSCEQYGMKINANKTKTMIIEENQRHRTHRHDTTVHDVIRLLIPALYKNQSDSLMAADGAFHHLCKLMAPVRHRWSINDVIGGIRNTVMPSDCSPIKDVVNCREPSIVSFIKKGRLRWLGHLQRMPEGRLPKRALYGHPGGLRKRGRTRLRWLQDVGDDLRRVGCKRWRQRAQDRDEWFLLIKEAQALHGL
ncbi:hypothetical protein ANN_25440 [Periplaneta americana]|uniref:Reverse transcriptase domain-containing protein n=1 Tax=Periplaneta americana TaxID=6978 RepID=A0ABQ8S1P5_PERAM|nr:hypothetical protein ANN_25440 [Periplaneta americana]